MKWEPWEGPHAAANQRLTQLLVLALAGPARAAVRVRLPLALGEDSEPEPDLAIVPPGAYKHERPTRARAVVEVAGSSLAQDRREKGTLYAEHGVPEHWIVDTAHERIEVHSEIVDGAYGRVAPHRGGDVVVSSSVPDLQVRVDDVFA